MKSQLEIHSAEGARGRRVGSKKTPWMAAGFLVFLGLDLFLFGNCVIPHHDASPETVKPGETRVGGHSLAALGIPIIPRIGLRYGLNDRTDMGFSGGFEVFGEALDFEEEVGGRYLERGAVAALGFDVKRAILSQEGKRLFTLQGGLMQHSAPWDPDSLRLGVSGMAGILMGSERFHFGARAHAGYQAVPFYQLEFPIGYTHISPNGKVRVELGLSPSVFIAKGATSIPWPWQYVGLQLDFGGGR